MLIIDVSNHHEFTLSLMNVVQQVWAPSIHQVLCAVCCLPVRLPSFPPDSRFIDRGLSSFYEEVRRVCLWDFTFYLSPLSWR